MASKKTLIRNAIKGNGVLADVGGMLRIYNGTCSNSHWIASWLAAKDQEYCQCGFECKVKVNYRGWDYWLTKRELYKLLDG